MTKYIVTSEYENGRPFYAEVQEIDYQDFLANYHNSTSNGSPLDVTKTVIQEVADTPEQTEPTKAELIAQLQELMARIQALPE